jgi:superfamily I DNA/RNA helicase
VNVPYLFRDMLNLSKAQRAAVEAAWKGTRTLIVACAGSGKTTVLAYRAVRIASQLYSENRAARLDAVVSRSDRCPLVDGGTSHAASNSMHAVLCLCFGNDAADELAQRVAALICEQKLEEELQCVRKFPRKLGPHQVVVHVTTLHAFGNRILFVAGPKARNEVCGLRESERRPLPQVTSYRDRAALIEICMREVGLHVPDKATKSGMAELRALKSMYSRKVLNYKAFCSDMESVNQMAAVGIPLQEAANVHLFGQELQLYHLYSEKLLEENRVEFCDMLGMSLSLIGRSKHVGRMISTLYDAVLVDEFQDLRPSELALVKRLSPNVSLVGDDDQNIYSFKHAFMNWLCLRQATAVWADMRAMTLTENHRCSANVVAFASAVITTVHGRIPKVLTAARPAGVPVEVVGTVSADLEAQFVARKIRELVGRKKIDATSSDTNLRVSYCDIAVLGRVNANLTCLMCRVKDVSLSCHRAIFMRKVLQPVGIRTLCHQFQMFPLEPASKRKHRLHCCASKTY